MRTGLLAIFLILIATSSAIATPQVLITSAPAVSTNESTATFAFNVTEGGTAVCQLDTSPFIPCTSPVKYTAVAEGEHTFRVRTGDFQASHTWAVDTAPPETLFTSAPTSPSKDPSPDFGLQSEPGAQFECSLNRAPYTTCDATPIPQPVRDGPNRFVARAVDRAGNRDSTPAVHVWVADVTPPASPIFTLLRFGAKSSGATVLPKVTKAWPTVVLARKSLLSWSTTEPGGLVTFSLKRLREERWTSATTAWPDDRPYLTRVYDDSGSGAVAKRIKPGKTATTLERGRSLCIAGITTAIDGEQSDDIRYACAARPFAIRRSSPRFKFTGTHDRPDKTAWGGRSVLIKPGRAGGNPVGEKIQVQMETGMRDDAYVHPIREATRISAISLVGRACKNCGEVEVAIAVVRNYGGRFDEAYTLKKRFSFRGTSNARAIRTINLAPNGPHSPYQEDAPFVTRLRLRAKGGPIRLAGIAIPGPAGYWGVPEDG